MSWDQDLRAALMAALGCPVAWGLAPQGQPVPGITLFQVGADPERTHDGLTGTWQGRVQVDCYAATRAEAATIERAVIAALDGFRGGALLLALLIGGPRDLPAEISTGARIIRRSLDFKVIYTEGV